MNQSRWLGMELIRWFFLLISLRYAWILLGTATNGAQAFFFGLIVVVSALIHVFISSTNQRPRVKDGRLFPPNAPLLRRLGPREFSIALEELTEVIIHSSNSGEPLLMDLRTRSGQQFELSLSKSFLDERKAALDVLEVIKTLPVSVVETRPDGAVVRRF